MRCYNMKCFNWKKTKCDTVCENRIATKEKAVTLGAWQNSVTVHQIGTSLGVYIPKEVCKRKQLKPGKKLIVNETETDLILSTPPTPNSKKIVKPKAGDHLFF